MRTESLLIVLAKSSFGLDNGLAQTPPMGWLSWERFGCEIDCSRFPETCISEKLYASMADRLVELGLDQLGFTYINIDDCWSAKDRSETDGKLIEDPIRFPSGISWLSNHIHERGLKFGMYTDIGTKTCAGYPGLGNGHTQKDVEQFVEWGIDSLKVDGCYAEVSEMSGLYSNLSDVLNKTGRPILFSCSWPAYAADHCENPTDMDTLQRFCHLWRNTDDIMDQVC